MNPKDPYGVPMGVVPRLAKRGMSNLRQAAQAALEALESLQGGCTDHDDGTVEAITVWCPEVVEALRTALAELQPEPVGDDIGKSLRYATHGAPVYAAPQAKQPLTDDPTNKHAIKVPGYGWVDTKAVRAIEAAHGIK